MRELFWWGWGLAILGAVLGIIVERRRRRRRLELELEQRVDELGRELGLDGRELERFVELELERHRWLGR